MLAWMKSCLPFSISQEQSSLAKNRPPSPAKNCATMDNKAKGASLPEHPVITLTWSTQAILREMPSLASTLRHSCIRAMKSATKLGFIARPAKAQVQFRRGKGREKSKEFSEHHNLRLDVSIHCA